MGRQVPVTRARSQSRVDDWQPWAAYVPRHVAEAIADSQLNDLVGKPRHMTGVVLFGDVAGFTPMSQVLAECGSRGTEDLNRLLNRYFATMVELIHSYGGEVVKFGGDAVTALFPCGSVPGEVAADRAVTCAFEMQEAMSAFRSLPTIAGDFSLAIKIGLAVGRVMWTVVGDPSLRLEHVLAGRPVDMAALAEHHAGNGQVVVHEDLLQLLDSVMGERTGSEFAVLRGARLTSSKAPTTPLVRLPAEVLPSISTFLHPLIAERLASGRMAFVNEHREVTTVFAAFAGTDYELDPSAGTRLQSLMTRVVRAAARFGGHLAQVDMGDKGSKYILFFGAPVLHEDDPERAIRCVLELLDHDHSTRAGVTTGLVFSGEVGSIKRREYLVMGDPVNLAARLMQRAEPGEILGSPAVQERTPAFGWSARGPLALKGKRPVEAWSLGAGARAADGSQERAYSIPVVGRRRELRRGLSCLERAAGRRGSVVTITGDPGIGKSRLTAEIARMAGLRGFLTCMGFCRSYDTAVTYLPWRGIFSGLFGIEPSAPLQVQQRQVRDSLALVGQQLIERAPLLRPVLNIPIEDNATTAQLDPELRVESLKQLLLDCLRHAANESPVLLLLEDCHWIDPASKAILTFLARNIADVPVVILLTWREATGDDPSDELSGLRHSVGVRLTELSRVESKKLLIFKLNELCDPGVKPAPRLVKGILEQAQGNPLYIEELANYARAEGVDLEDPGAEAASVFPDSLKSLIMARIDRLTDAERATLKIASVIGRTFKADWISGSYPSVGGPQEVAAHLDSLSARDLTPLYRREPDLEYSFKHAITQDVAYESLTFANRRVLHDRVARHIEAAYPSPDPVVDELAYHYSRGNNKEKQRFYLRLAGDKSKASFANDAAIDYYENLLELLPEADKTEVLLDLGEVSQLLGEWSRSRAFYDEALRLARRHQDRLREARANAALGYLLTYTESLDEAVLSLGKARQGFTELCDDRGEAQTLEYLGHASFFLGDYRSCVAYSNELLELAESMGDNETMSAAYGNRGRAHWRLGELPAALEDLGRSLERATEVDHQKGVIHASSDIAGLYSQLGDPINALEYLQQALDTAARIGYQLIVSISIGNAGILYREHGDHVRALACYKTSLAMALELGHWPGICNIMMELGVLFTSRSRNSEAGRVLGRAVEISRRLNVREFQCDSLFHYAEYLCSVKRPEDAAAPALEALELAVQTEERKMRLAAENLVTRIAVTAGRMSRADGTARLEALLEEPLAAEERADVCYALWRVDATLTSHKETATRLYRSMYEGSPRIGHAKRYQEMTGRTLPPPAPLSDLRGVKARPAAALSILLARVDELMSNFPDERVG